MKNGSRRLLSRHRLPELIRELIPVIVGATLSASLIELYRYLDKPSPKPIVELINQEAEFAQKAPESVTKYMGLFTADAAIMNVHDMDAYFGTAKIEERYRGLSNLKVMHELVPGSLQFIGDVATATTTSQIQVGGATRTGREEWWFQRIDGQWKIRTFRFNTGQ